MDPALFLADLEAKPASLRALADALAHGNAVEGAGDAPAAGAPDRDGLVALRRVPVARRLRAHRVPVTAEYASTDPLPPSSDRPPGR